MGVREDDTGTDTVVPEDGRPGGTGDTGDLWR